MTVLLSFEEKQMTLARAHNRETVPLRSSVGSDVKLNRTRRTNQLNKTQKAILINFLPNEARYTLSYNF